MRLSVTNVQIDESSSAPHANKSLTHCGKWKQINMNHIGVDRSDGACTVFLLILEHPHLSVPSDYAKPSVLGDSNW